MIRRIAEIIPERRVDPKKLGWLSGKRAETRANFPANFEYVDLRGFTLADLAAELDFEEAAYRDLELKGFSQASIDEIDRKQSTASAAPVVDFGVASAVVALSAFGCIPVTSCRGPTLGRRLHSQPAPMVVFYARASHVPLLLEAVSQSGCQIVNNDAKVEIYADELIKLHRFSMEMLRLMQHA
ncbi:MAG TPA: hypothetical protein VFG62_22510 [Rhodopila sp.]|jgi:hypothetical protein|nr:hypothetical protein [Rhodopila sp.]